MKLTSAVGMDGSRGVSSILGQLLDQVDGSEEPVEVHVVVQVLHPVHQEIHHLLPKGLVWEPAAVLPRVHLKAHNVPCCCVAEHPHFYPPLVRF